MSPPRQAPTLALAASVALTLLLVGCPTEVTTTILVDPPDADVTTDVADPSPDALDTSRADVPADADPVEDALAEDAEPPDAEPPDTGSDAVPLDVPEDTTSEDVAPDAPPDTPPDTPAPPCPPDMVAVDDTFCIDRHEAPNLPGEPPLVMMSLLDAQRWCAARDKRTCYDDEWTLSCAGPDGAAYPYGATHQTATCRDDALWRVYTQSLLNGWPAAASSAAVSTFADQFAIARAAGPAGQAAADHVEALYQGTAAGAHPGCGGFWGVFDLVGNVEEWTTRRDGGDGPGFTGALKGRYWAESRTCQSAVRNHADAFRFYETGFRCCRDVE